MRDVALDALTRRLDRLEREVRWWRWLATAVLAGACVLASVAASAPAKVAEVLRAKRIEIVDGKGRARIELGNLPDSSGWGDTGMVVRSPSGRIAAALAAVGTLESQGATLSLHDREGRARLAIQTVSSRDVDKSSVKLWGQFIGNPTGSQLEESEEQIELSVDSQRGARDPRRSSATLAIRTGKVGAGFWSDGGAGTIALNFSRYEGAPPSGALGDGLLGLGMTQGAPWFALGDGHAGWPGLVLGRRTLKHNVTGAEEHRPSSSLVMFDKDGKVVWKAP